VRDAEGWAAVRAPRDHQTQSKTFSACGGAEQRRRAACAGAGGI